MMGSLQTDNLQTFVNNLKLMVLCWKSSGRVPPVFRTPADIEAVRVALTRSHSKLTRRAFVEFCVV